MFKMAIGQLIFTLLILFTIRADSVKTSNGKRERSFEIDYVNDVFLMDGEPFQYIAGSFHYFRCPHQYWRERLRTMRAAGLNTVTTYVEWSFHEPKYREYDFTGDKDLVKFIEIAEEEDLYVILRPGPYICAERDMGGFPYWLLTKYPNIKLRTFDSDYLIEVVTWYAVMMSKMEPYLYGNGGPIIMVQVENEYGSYKACDRLYMSWLAEQTNAWVRGAALLFTTDGPTLSYLECGAIPGVFATVDFGPGYNVSEAWSVMRQVNGGGPVVNSEFYPGWFTHWGENAITVPTDGILKTFKEMLDTKGNVNFYVFYGGTNFAYTAGANISPKYMADITSYDYDAPMTEAGDTTSKYMGIREMISEYFTMPDLPVPPNKPKNPDGARMMIPILELLSPEGRRRLGTEIVFNEDPLSFEALDQNSGLILYETKLPSDRPDLTTLTVNGLHDRGYVYTDEGLMGILSRTEGTNTVSIKGSSGNNLGILVENQGRVNYGLAEDFKGILGNVTLDTQVLKNWTMTKYPLETIESAVDDLILPLKGNITNLPRDIIMENGPVVFASLFWIGDELLDSYLDLKDWGKGIVWLNDRNLGRYWPEEGPQATLYVPGVYFNLSPKENKLIILELEKIPVDMPSIEFIDEPNLGHED